MMHLKYPRKRAFLYWDELGCLARALGFHEKIFLHHLPDELMIGRLGISIQTFYEAFDLHKSFHTALDRTYNIHTDEWNISVIKKALQLLDKHVFTFEEIELIRITYQVYESPDTRGLHLQEKILQRVIKMCDRMISPLKMMQRVKHMAQHFEENDRIQLNEFLDLLLWCEFYQGVVFKAQNMNISKNEEEMFELENFEEMLTYYDERLANTLDQKYIQDEWKFTKERFGSKCLPKDVPPVDPQIRQKQVRYHGEKYRFLHREINDSTKRVVISKAGYVRGRPVSAPDVLMYQYIDPSVALSTLHPRPRSVREVFGHVIRPATAQSTREDIQESYPRPTPEKYQRPNTPVAVSTDDMASGKNKVSTLKFEMETVDMKYKQLLKDDLNYLVPGYRERKQNAPKTPPPTPPPKPKREPRPSQDTIDKLSDPHKKRLPRPSHARVCDARFRGWYKVKTTRGPHFVLTSSQLDKSPNGLMLAKQRRLCDAEIKREPIIYRFTQRHEVTSGELRPWTSPAVMVTGDQSTPMLDSFPKSDFSSKEGPTDSPKAAVCERLAGGDLPGKVTNDEEVCSETSSGIGWNDLAVYQEEESNNSSGNDSSEGSETRAAIEAYLPPPKGEFNWKGNDFHSRRERLEGIKEMKEEEDAKSERGFRVRVVVSKTKESAKLAEQPEVTPLDAIKVTESPSTQHNHATKAHDPPSRDTMTKSHELDNNMGNNDDVFTSWFYPNKRAVQYPWIPDIIRTDFSHRWRQQHEDYNFCRLSRRGQGSISRDFQRRLIAGIPT